MEAQKKPNPVDVHVGARLKQRRTMLGMSQEKLGEHLGITFQQIQKYEKGTNRISFARLVEIADALEAPLSYFYADLPGQQAREDGFAESDAARYVSDFLSTSQGQQLNRAFIAIADPKIRQRIVELVKALAEKSE